MNEIEEIRTTYARLSKDLVHAQWRMDIFEIKAFDLSLSELEYGGDGKSIEVNLNYYLNLPGIPKSYTKEKAANIFRGLTKPVILFEKNGTPIPAYKKVEWRGDTIFLEIHPTILTHVLTSHNLFDQILGFAQKEFGGEWKFSSGVDFGRSSTKSNKKSDGTHEKQALHDEHKEMPSPYVVASNYIHTFRNSDTGYSENEYAFVMNYAKMYPDESNYEKLIQMIKADSYCPGKLKNTVYSTLQRWIKHYDNQADIARKA